MVSPGPNCITETATAATASGLSAGQARVWTVALRPLTSRTPPSNGLHLREAAVHKQFCSCDEACVIGGEKHDRLGDLIRSEEHTSELQSRLHLVCRLLLGKKKKCYNSGVAFVVGISSVQPVGSHYSSHCGGSHA